MHNCSRWEAVLASMAVAVPQQACRVSANDGAFQVSSTEVQVLYAIRAAPAAGCVAGSRAQSRPEFARRVQRR